MSYPGSSCLVPIILTSVTWLLITKHKFHIDHHFAMEAVNERRELKDVEMKLLSVAVSFR